MSGGGKRSLPNYSAAALEPVRKQGVLAERNQTTSDDNARGPGVVRLLKLILQDGSPLSAVEHQLGSMTVQDLSMMFTMPLDNHFMEPLLKVWPQLQEYRCTCLHLAVILGRVEVCRALVNKGVDLGNTDDYGNTGLVLAAAAGNTALVDLLLDAGAGIAAANRFGQTALHVASSGGHDVVVGALLKRPGSEVNAASGCADEVPLFCASFLGHVKVARVLLQGGARVNQTLSCGLTPLHMAARSNSIKLLQLLAQSGAHLNALARVTQGDSHTLRFPFQPHAVHKGSALNFAAEKSVNGKAVKVLLELGADPNAVTERSPKTPLMIAAQRLKLPTLRLLLDAGAQLDNTQWKAASPLLCAVRGYVQATWVKKEARVLECVKMLVEAGASLAAKDPKHGLTCLHLSLHGELVSVFEYLLEHGGNPFREDRYGESVFKSMLQGDGTRPVGPWILRCLRAGVISEGTLQSYYSLSPLNYCVFDDDLDSVKMYEAAGFLRKKYFDSFDPIPWSRVGPYIKKAFTRVLNLKRLSRKAVSDAIGMRAWRRAGILALPSQYDAVKRYLLYDDLSSEPVVHFRANRDWDKVMRQPYDSDNENNGNRCSEDEDEEEEEMED